MTVKNFLRNVCVATLFSCVATGAFLVGWAKTVTTKADVKELSVLWIQDYEKNEETNRVSFSIKTNSFNSEIIENYQSKSLEYIKVNDVNLLQILENDETANVSLDVSTIRVTMALQSADLQYFPYAIQEDENDKIVVEKGFYLPTLETNPYTMEFCFDEVLKKFVVVGNPDILDESEYTGTVLYEVHSDNYNYRQLFIHFTYPITTEYMHHLQYDAETYAKQMRKIGSQSPTDLYCAQLSLIGVRDTLLNNIVVDGKSLREWMIFDKDKVHDPENLVMISMHSSYDRGTLLTVEFSPASSCDPSDEGLHTLELRDGIVFPTKVRLTGTHKYSYDHKADGSVDNQWIAMGAETEIEGYNPTKNGENTGCSGSILTGSATGIVCSVVISGAALVRKRKCLRVGQRRKNGEK